MLSRRVPRPLAALMLLAVVEALAWACLLPPWQGPDEIKHLAYVQRIVDGHSIGWTAFTGHPSGPPYSTELSTADAESGLGALAANAGARTFASGVDERRWARADARLPAGAGADGGYNHALRNPPLYYLALAPLYAAVEGGSPFERDFVLRLANIPLLLVVVVCAWALTGELLGRRRWLQTVAAGVVALQPQLTQAAGMVNPDLLLTALWSAAIYLMVVAVRRPPSRRLVGGLLALAAASALTHERGAPLLGVVAAALAIAWWKRGAPHTARQRRAALTGAGVAAAATVAGTLFYALRGDVTLDRARQFGSYVWQFYLPRLPGMAPPLGPHWTARDAFVDRLWSAFAQFEVELPHRALDALAVATVLGLALLVAGLLARRDRLRAHAATAGVLVLSLLVLLAVVHAAAWRALLLEPDDPVVTGRYLLPVIVLFGAAVAVALSWLPRRAGPAAGTLVLGAGVLVQLAALGLVTTRFYV